MMKKKKKKTFRESSIIRRNYYLSVFFPVATVYVFVVRHSGEDRTDLRQMPPFSLSTPTIEENDGKVSEPSVANGEDNDGLAQKAPEAGSKRSSLAIKPTRAFHGHRNP
ncbi:hypothetical protein RUM43_012203 [Polyplax serrata]|uniref:Uncharacterized protein n=1 Tax=Polyplax serrata TaxID=468196 RepID=A0AAN8NRV4_POLSC